MIYSHHENQSPNIIDLTVGHVIRRQKDSQLAVVGGIYIVVAAPSSPKSDQLHVLTENGEYHTITACSFREWNSTGRVVRKSDLNSMPSALIRLRHSL